MSAKFRRNVIGLALLLAPCSGICEITETTCTIAVSSVAFGNYDIFNPIDTDSEGTIVIACERDGGPRKVPVTIAIEPIDSVSEWEMEKVGGNEKLKYNLYLMWGGMSGTTVSQVVDLVNNASTQITVSIFGRILAGQDVGVGSYSDSVMVTVDY